MRGREYLNASKYERWEALTRMWPNQPANVNALLAMPDDQAAGLLDRIESERRHDQPDYDRDDGTDWTRERKEDET